MNKLRKILLTAMLLAMPFFNSRAMEWYPTGESIDENGYALDESGDYADGDRIISSAEGDFTMYSFSASADEDADNTVTINGCLNADEGRPLCSLKIDGEVVLDATEANLDVSLTSSVVIEPFFDALAPEGASEGTGYSQIVFNAAEGMKITVNVDYDLTFQGVTSEAGSADGYADLYLSFVGAGQTDFIMADGTKISFDGQIDDTCTAEEPTALAGGTKVFVTMDQTADQFDKGVNKVLFERLNDGDASLRTMVYVGPNSLITYVSDLYESEGLDEASESGETGYASIGFDPSTRYLVEVEGSEDEYEEYFGTGRMVLFVKGAYTLDEDLAMTTYPFNDGAIVVAGHYVSNFYDEEESYSALRTAYAEDTNGYDYSTPSGFNAVLRVVDHNCYEAGSTEFVVPEASKCGLLVVNDCQSLGKYSADPYLDNYGEEPSAFAYSQSVDMNVRPGFVLGVNGIIDVYDNAFFDYVGGASNKVDDLASTAADDATRIKMHNPSALVVDDLDDGLFYWYDADSEEYTTISSYSPADPFTVDGYFDINASVMHPQFILRGNAKALFKNASSSTYGFIYNLFVGLDEEGDPVAYDAGSEPYNDSTIDITNYLAVSDLDADGFFSTVSYDGYQLENTDNTTTGEGEHVLDVQGRFSVFTYANNSIYTNDADPVLRTYGDYDETYNGQFGMASLLTDYAADEITLDTVDDEDGSYQEAAVITRPLSLTGSYMRYNSPAFNVDGIMNFYDTYIVHNDPSKYVTGEPLYSEPAVVGGGSLYFVLSSDFDQDTYGLSFPNRYRFPEIRLYNSYLKLHESLCSSGVRYVVKDYADTYDDVTTPVSNESEICFYNHGHDLDNNLTGFGRMFVLGSQLNLMSGDDGSGYGATNYITESAFLNVFRHSLMADDNSYSTIKLALRTDNELPEGVASQSSQHFVWMGIPTATDALVGVYLGWPGLNADGLPYGDTAAYPYVGEYLGDDSTTQFTLDANVTYNADAMSAAELAIEGNLINFNACDENAVGARVPVKDEYDSGNIFVDYGGKFGISENATDVRTAAIPVISTYIETSVASRFWPDYDYAGTTRLTWYSGQVDLPRAQTIYGDGYGVQPYGITSDMLTANLEESDGYIRLGYDNSDRSNLAQKTGAEELTIAWPYRDALMAPITKLTDTPISRTTDLPYILYAGAGDDIKKINVSGATLADPFYMDVSGDGTNPTFAIVRAYASLKSTRDTKFIGEGEHALLCVEYGGTIGLGGDKLYAWTQLGKDYVTICPLGDGTVNLNGNVSVADSLALLASDKFGNSDYFNTGASSHRLRFYSPRDCEIRVPANGELDLSSFGQSNGRQEIAFDGKVKLVLEPGATIRFPDASVVDGGVVLYFNGESELVFEGISDALKGMYSTRIASNDNRIKFLGKGQIWLNKNAKMKVMGSALVGVQAEAGATTDVTINLQRQSQFLLGDTNVQGGSFEVGNPESKTGAVINFKLALNGPQALFHIDREGFFGLGAGIVNKLASNPNGSALASANPTIDANTLIASKGEDQLVYFNPDEPTYVEADVEGGTAESIAYGDEGEGTAWQVHALYNVSSVTLDLVQGAFEHMNIYDGSSSNASLMAIGTSAAYAFKLNGLTNFVFRGGGNLMYVPTAPDSEYTSLPFHVVNVWDYASPITTGEQYSLLSNSKMLLSKTASTAATEASYLASGKTLTFSSASNLFSFLGFEPYTDQTFKFADVGATQFGPRTGFVNYDTASRRYGAYEYDSTTTTTTSWSKLITRNDGALVNNGNANDAIEVGALQCTESNANGPTSFGVPSR